MASGGLLSKSACHDGTIVVAEGLEAALGCCGVAGGGNDLSTFANTVNASLDHQMTETQKLIQLSKARIMSTV